MLQQVYLDIAYADATLADGTHVFALRDPITVPERHSLQVRLLNAYLPHSYYSIFEDVDTLVLAYDDGGEERAPDVTVRLLHGNRSVDDIVAYLNDGRLQDYVASYDENTNRLTLEGTDDADAVLVVKAGTTCQRLLGLRVGDRATLSDDFHFRLTGSSVVDLTRTSSAFVHSNLLTQNRDPRTRRVGDILAKIPSSAQFNEIDHYTADAFVSVANRYLSYVSLRLSDDDGRTLDLNGGRFTATLKLSFDRSNEQQDEPVPAGGVAAAAEREAGGAGRPQSNRIAVPGAGGAGDGGGGGERPAGR
jgi:hypothetical protein